MKYKVEPQNRRVRKWMDENGAKTVTKCIGYDFAEGHRGSAITTKDLGKGRMEHYWYPLIEWQWTRKECVDAICRHGLPQAGKSSCFFCPAMKLREITAPARPVAGALPAGDCAGGERQSQRPERGLGLWRQVVGDRQSRRQTSSSSLTGSTNMTRTICRAGAMTGNFQ
jgi:hypothetical protein